MKRTLLYCAVLALAAGSIAPATHGQVNGDAKPTADARHWLQRMVQSAQTLSYEGTFIYVQGPHIEAMRIVHGGGPDGQRQRLFSLNGAPREILVANNGVTCLLPEQKARFPGADYRGSPFLPAIPQDLDRLEQYYDLRSLGEDRVAGLDAQVIAIKPRDGWRYGYRLWLDRRNGIVLRSALLDEHEHPVEQLMFTDLQLKPVIDEASLQSPALPAVESAAVSPPAEQSAAETVTQSHWQVEPLPAGFVKVLHNRISPAVAGRAGSEHMVFADGLATVSVFLEALQEGATPLLQGESRLGLMNAYGTVVDGHQVLVVGEVPAVTVQRIAAALHRDPAEK